MTEQSWQERLWSNIKLAPGESCWEWKKYRNQKGYGRTSREDRLYLAHRLAYESANGPIPEGLDVLHKCDNPPCCRPDHLFTGTNDQNVKDRQSKGRSSKKSINRGEKNGMSKFSPSQVQEIRTLASQGLSTHQIAKRYGVWNMAIWRIVKRKRWAHI